MLGQILAIGGGPLGGFSAGYAADDGVALHFVGTELREVVSSQAGAQAYRLESGGETPLEARVLR